MKEQLQQDLMCILDGKVDFDTMTLVCNAVIKCVDERETDIRDSAIRITDALIEMGYVPDCTDTDDETEFEIQDRIVDILNINNQ